MQSASGEPPVSLQDLVRAINELLPPVPPLEVLERLTQALHGTDQPASDEDRRALIAETAADVTEHGIPSAIELLEQANAYAHVRETLLAKWPDLPFRVRMMLRERAISYEENEAIWLRMTLEERQSFVDSLEPEARTRFIFDRYQTMLMVRELRPLIDADAEVSKARTSFEVWDEVKRADPGMEDALFKPLDPSKFVKRDMEKTPRRFSA